MKADAQTEGLDAGCVEFELGKECNTQDCPRTATRGGLCEAHWASRRGDRDRKVTR